MGGDFYRAHKNEGNIAAKHRAGKGNTSRELCLSDRVHT
jgi:hypothetical protein